MDDMPGPSTVGLRAASANLMIDRLGEQARRRLEDGARLQRYYVSAEAVGVGRAMAAAILAQAQGNRGGSTPTETDIDAAWQRVMAHAMSATVPMSDALRAAVQHLASTTRYGQADLGAAVEALRGIREPWPDERIASALPTVAEIATRGPYSLAEAARKIREVSTWMD